MVKIANLIGGSKQKPTMFSKKVDAKLGKGFCTAVKKSTITPILGAQAVGAFAKEVVKTTGTMVRGLEGPMRTDGRYCYERKCDVYIALFGVMMEKILDKSRVEDFQTKVLWPMVDDGMFKELNYEQFIRQLRMLHIGYLQIEEGKIDRFLNDPVIQKDLKGMWVA